MYLNGICLLLVATVPVLHAQSKQCGLGQFKCKDGNLCISTENICDSNRDCPDGSDEVNCGNKRNITVSASTNKKCSLGEFKCKDGDLRCIPSENICDSTKDCLDGSDEVNCGNKRNRTDSVPLSTTTKKKCSWAELECRDGKCIPTESICNSIKDCADGWDEENCNPRPASYTPQALTTPRITTTAPRICNQTQWQCTDGTCISENDRCNGFEDCIDGSDETQFVCGDLKPPLKEPTNKCTLPPYPLNGLYTVTNAPSSRPGQSSNFYVLNVTCSRGYGVMGDSQVFCSEGAWSPSDTLPECRRLCKVIRHPSVEHACRFTIGGSIGSRPCNDYEPPGTIAWPECVRPHYFFVGELPTMRCGDDGNWDNNPTCTPDCGQVTPEGAELIVGGHRAKRGELPWHTGIYRKTTTPFLQICGGSLVRPNVVVSAAHCFWHDENKILPAMNFAVAVGKVYRPWDDPHDDAQVANVQSLHIPSRFRGSTSNFMEDLAVLRLSVSFVYQPHIKPVCLDFEENFDHFQLAEGVTGKVAGWGLTDVNGPESPVLKVVELPIVSFAVCFNESPANFRAYITADKICAGYKNKGTAVCKGDSGGGLVVPQYERGTYRYYLRGVVSTAPNDENLCNANTITTFTHLRKHARFIKNYL